MAANDEILGISGHLDISDIDRSINEMINNLDKIGVKTDALSKRVSEAMREIAQSTDDSATKQKRAMEVFAQATEEAKTALSNYPEQIRLAKEAMQQTELATTNLEKELAKLNTQLNASVIGSDKYNQLKTSIAGVEQQIHNNTNAYQAQSAVVQQMEEGYNGLVSMLGVANASTAANAVAHSAVTAATVVEAGAHASNAEKIGEETKASIENKSAKDLQSESEKKVAEAIELELSSYDKLIDRIKSGTISNDEYQRSIEAIRSRLAALNEERQKTGAKYDVEAEKLNTSDMVNGELVSRGSADVVNELAKQYNILEGQIGALQGTLNEAEQAWNSVHQKASQGAENVTQKIKDTEKAEEELNQESSKEPTGFKAQWNAVNELHDKIQSLTTELRNYEAEYDKLAEKPGFDPQSKKAQELTGKINNLKKEISDTKKEMSEESGVGGFLAKWKNNVVDAATENGKFQESLGNMKTALGGLVAPFTAATSGAVAFGKALWAMAATPIGAVLSAIVLALQALFAWFKKDAEGQRAFAKITAYLGSLLSSLMDIAVKIGKYLYHAFADPQGALNQFGKGLVGLVINPLKAIAKTLSGVGQIAKGVFDLIASGANVAEAKKAVEGIKKGWEDLQKAGSSAIDTLKSGWDTLAGAAKGTVKLIGEGIKQGWTSDLGAIGADMFGRAKKAAQLAEQELNAQKALSEAKVKEKQLEIDIAREREKIYMLTGKEKDAQIELVKNMLKEKYDGPIAAQKELLRITKERNALHTMSIESYAKEREAQGAVYTLEAQRAASTRMLVRMQQANLRSMANADKKDTRQQQQIDDAEARMTEIIRKNSVARAKAEQDMEQKITDARIAAMKDGAEKVIAEKNRAFEKELEQLDEQRKAAIEAERARQKAEFDAQEKIIKAHGGKPQEWSEEMIDNSAIEKINAQFEQLRALASEQRANDELKTQMQSMRDYLKQYGTFQQQKLAIAEEYAEKIAKAEAVGNTGEAMRLRKEQDAAFGESKARELARGIDFSQMLDGVGTIVKEIAKQTYSEVQKYKQTDEYKNSKAETKQAIANLEAKLVEKGGAGYASPFNAKTWDDITKAAKKYQDSLKNLQEKTDAHTNAVEELKAAEDMLKNATSENAKGFLQGQVNKLKEKEKTTGADQQQAEGQLVEAQGEVTTATTIAAQGLQDFNSAISQITSGSLSGFANGISSLIGQLTGKGAQDITGLLGEKVGGIIGAIIGLIDAMGDNPGQFLGDLVDKIFNIINTFLDQLFSGELTGKLVEAIVKGVTELIGNIVGQVGKGGVFGMAFNIVGGVFNGIVDGISKGLGFTKDTRAEADSVITRSNSILESIDKNVDKIRDKMTESYGVSAISEYQKLLGQYQGKYAQYNAQIQAAGDAYYGSRHSEWYYRNDNGGEGAGGYVDRIRRLLGIDGTGWGTAWQGFFNQLAMMGDEGAKKLATLRENAQMYGGEWAEIWHQINETGWDDEGRISRAANEWADTIAKMESDFEKFNEVITGTTKEGVLDQTLGYFYDFADGVEDVTDKAAEDWQKMVNRMVIKNSLADQLQKFVQGEDGKGGWYGELAELNRQYTLGLIDREQYLIGLKKLKEEYNKALEEGQKQIEDYREAGLIESVGNEQDKQSATINSIEKISYDQADSLVGIETAKLISTEQILEQQKIQTQEIGEIAAVVPIIGADINTIKEGVQEIVETQGSMNTHLANISRYTSVLPTMADDISRIKKKVNEQ